MPPTSATNSASAAEPRSPPGPSATALPDRTTRVSRSSASPSREDLSRLTNVEIPPRKRLRPDVASGLRVRHHVSVIPGVHPHHRAAQQNHVPPIERRPYLLQRLKRMWTDYASEQRPAAHL